MEITDQEKEKNGSMENLNAAITQNEVSNELQVLFHEIPSDVINSVEAHVIRCCIALLFIKGVAVG